MPQGTFNFGINQSRTSWRRKLSDRLFFGVLPNTDTAFQIDRMRRQFCDENHLEGALRGRERLHVSLHYLGDYPHLPPRIIYAAKLAGRAISMPSFEVTLNAIGSFVIVPPSDERPGKHALVLFADGVGLVEIHRALGAAMRGIGLRAGEHFTPHVTLLYGPDAVPKQAIEPIRLVVRDFVLIHSEVGLSKYNVIEGWPLNAIQ